MHNLFRKAGAAVMSAAIAVNGLCTVPAIVSAADTAAKFEFEDAEITGDVKVKADAKASGGSVLRMEESGTITLKLTAEADDIYNLTVYAGGIGSSKQQGIAINGVSLGDLAIPESEGYEAIKIPAVKLKKGENTLVITKSWGWSQFDYIEVEKAVMPDIKASQTTPCDSSATKEAVSLMAYLNSVYGSNILSGQQEIYSSGHGGNFEVEFDYLKDLTGKLPAVRGFDFLNEANILYGSEDKTVDRIIDWVNNKNGIATASWHLTVPKNFANYNVGDKIQWGDATYSCTWDDAKTKNTATDFNTANVVKSGTKENEYYMACLKELSGYLLKLQDANVPLIFRPLHEAEGGGGEAGSWFWWGASGSAVYKEIWKLTYKTLTEDYGIHNIIWEWNSYNFDTSENWYPGDEYVDIIGYDKYSCVKYLAENNWQPSYVHDDSPITSTFYGIMEKYDSKKMVAMAENDCFSTVDNLTSEKAGWLYFCTWYDGGGQTDFLSDPIFNTKEDTIAMYQSDYCITLDELPSDLYKNTSVTTGTTTSKSTTTAVTTTAVSSTIADSTTTSAVTTEAAYKFEVIKKAVVLPDTSKENCVLEVTVKGEPTASIGGAFGFSNGPTPEDWKNIEWKGNADKSGVLTVSVPLKDVPDSVTSGEVQIWWSNVWDAAAEKGIDKPCEITEVNVKTAEVETTSTTTSAATTTAATTTTAAATTSAAETSTAPEVTLWGDANCDNGVNLADAVFIMQSISNPDKYGVGKENGMTKQGEANGDVSGNGDGLTNKDALAIQKFKLGLIEKLPV